MYNVAHTYYKLVSGSHDAPWRAVRSERTQQTVFSVVRVKLCHRAGQVTKHVFFASKDISCVYLQYSVMKIK